MWIRTCQECGYKQISKSPLKYKNEAWRNVKCKKCGSEALDYGSVNNDNDREGC